MSNKRTGGVLLVQDTGVTPCVSCGKQVYMSGVKRVLRYKTTTEELANPVAVVCDECVEFARKPRNTVLLRRLAEAVVAMKEGKS